jgi:hypothetical protein
MRVLIVFAVIVLSTLSVQARHGSMELICIPPLGVDIRLPATSLERSLVLHLWASPTSALQKNKTLAVTATRCVTPEKCETGKGTIRFDQFALERKASGTYNLQFGDEREEGAFAVKRQRQENPLLCE